MQSLMRRGVLVAEEFNFENLKPRNGGHSDFCHHLYYKLWVLRLFVSAYHTPSLLELISLATD